MTTDDPARGTGRTTRMIARAVFEISMDRGVTAYVAGRSLDSARCYRDLVASACGVIGLECRVKAVTLGEAEEQRRRGALVFIDHSAHG